MEAKKKNKKKTRKNKKKTKEKKSISSFLCHSGTFFVMAQNDWFSRHNLAQERLCSCKQKQKSFWMVSKKLSSLSSMQKAYHWWQLDWKTCLMKSLMKSTKMCTLKVSVEQVKLFLKTIVKRLIFTILINLKNLQTTKHCWKSGLFQPKSKL